MGYLFEHLLVDGTITIQWQQSSRFFHDLPLVHKSQNSTRLWTKLFVGIRLM